MNALHETISLTDFDDCAVGAGEFFDTKRLKLRDTTAIEAKLVSDFEQQNRMVLSLYNVNVAYSNNGRGGLIRFQSADYVGALPIKSPLSGRWDMRMVIQPRVGWSSLGGVLTATGGKVLPELQHLPMIPRSAREIPSWVVASVILSRLEGLLGDVSRKYVSRKEELQSPKGRIDWQIYVARQLPQCKWLDIPCEYSELGNHPDLMGMIRYTLQKIHAELSANREGGIVVLQLLERARNLMRKVVSYLPVKPTLEMLSPLFYGKSQNAEKLVNGLEAIQWSEENRGLAGLSDFRGIPWRMSMAEFFEAYVETIVKRAAVYSGGTVTCGRKLETVIPVQWDVLWQGTQKSLRPDVVLMRGEEVVIIDAKFKGYWHQIFLRRWEDVQKEFREEHRNDLLQVLAYSTCFASRKITVCLVYACESSEYQSLLERGLLHRCAHIIRKEGSIDLVLTVVPMQGNIDDIARELSNCWCQPSL